MNELSGSRSSPSEDNNNYKSTAASNGDTTSDISSSKYDLKYAVQLPVNEDLEEWIAKCIFDFHKQIRMLFCTIDGYCTPTSCPRMTAGKRFEYQWADENSKEPVRFTAAEYIHHLLDWVEELLDDDDVFPSKSIEKKFPNDFLETCQTISKRLLRVYSHIYHHHLDVVKNYDMLGHINTSLKHFIYFVKEFNLVGESDLDPLRDFILT